MRGDFSPHNAASLSAESQQYEGFSCRVLFIYSREQVPRGTATIPFGKR